MTLVQFSVSLGQGKKEKKVITPEELLKQAEGILKEVDKAEIFTTVTRQEFPTFDRGGKLHLRTFLFYS